jgi:hypothetical protein
MRITGDMPDLHHWTSLIVKILMIPTLIKIITPMTEELQEIQELSAIYGTILKMEKKFIINMQELTSLWKIFD